MNKGRGITASILGGERLPPTLRLPFYEGRLDSRITFTGGANRTYTDPYKVLQNSSTNVARFDHLLSDGTPLGLSVWEARTNGIRNNTMTGASAGTPGTDPNNWGIGLSGVSQEIVAVGTISGINTIDYKLSGTPTGTIVVNFEGIADINALDTETWTNSAFIALIAGDLSNINKISLDQLERTEAGDNVKVNSGSDVKGSLTATLQRFVYTVTLSGGGTVAHVRPRIAIDWTGSGDIDLTLRIGLPTEEKGTGASPVIKTTSAAVTATADVATMSDVTWFNQSEGTFLVEANQPALISGTTFLIQIDDGSDTDRILLTLSSSSKPGIDTVNSGGNNGGSAVAGAITAGTSFKATGAYAQNDVIAGLDGTLDASPDTSADLPATDTLTTVRIGKARAASNFFNGTIKLIEYSPYRMWNGFLTYETQ